MDHLFHTGKHAATLPRLDVFAFTFGFVFFATDQFVTRLRPLVGNISRVSSLLLFFFVGILFSLVLPMHEHWCCYGAHFNIDSLTLGLCTDNKAPIHSSPLRKPCGPASVHTGIWVWIGLTLSVFVVFFGFFLFRAWWIRRDLRQCLLIDFGDIMSLVDEHRPVLLGSAGGGDDAFRTVARLEANLQVACKVYKENKDSQHWGHSTENFKSGLLLHRSIRFLIDPASYTFNYPAIALHLHALHVVLQVVCVSVWFTCLFFLWYHSLPAWRHSCCIRTEALHLHGLGSCADTESFVSRSDAKKECSIGTITWQLWVEIVFAVLAFTVAGLEYTLVCIKYYQHATDMVLAWLQACAKETTNHLDDPHVTQEHKLEMTKKFLDHLHRVSEVVDVHRPISLPRFFKKRKGKVAK